MLASTVQFSNNPPTNPDNHPPPREAGQISGLIQKKPHTPTPTHSAGRAGGPVSSGPNSVPSHDVPPMSNHQTHTRRPRGHLTPPTLPTNRDRDVVSSLERR